MFSNKEYVCMCVEDTNKKKDYKYSIFVQTQVPLQMQVLLQISDTCKNISTFTKVLNICTNRNIFTNVGTFTKVLDICTNINIFTNVGTFTNI